MQIRANSKRISGRVKEIIQGKESRAIKQWK